MNTTDSVSPLLEVEDLRLQFRAGTKVVRAVDGVSFSLGPGFHRPAVAVYASERHPIRGRVRRGRTIGPSAGIARIDAC